MFALTKDETGAVFGKLTVLGLADERKNGRVTWRCACECGGSKNVEGVLLRKGTVRSCGCALSEAKRTLRYGDRFGRLRVVGYDGRSKWRCECDCGSVISANASNLTRGSSRSCGCLRSETQRTHGLSRTKEYRIWSGMVERCGNPNRNGYQHYGGRGIRVCARWLTFENFYADIGPIPDGLTLDRIDVNGNYEPGNVRLASWSTQRTNRRSAKEVALQSLSVEEMENALLRKRVESLFG